MLFYQHGDGNQLSLGSKTVNTSCRVEWASHMLTRFILKLCLLNYFFLCFDAKFYFNQVSNTSKFGTFLSLLIRWRGSIYKLVLAEYENWLSSKKLYLFPYRYFIWLTIYMILSLLYRLALNDSQRNSFEVVELCYKNHFKCIYFSKRHSLNIVTTGLNWYHWTSSLLSMWPRWWQDGGHSGM